MTDSRLIDLLRALIDGWCERRALRPLAVLLPAYLGFNGLTDGSHDLWDAVNNLRGLGDALTDEEHAAVVEVRAAIYQTFKSVGRQAELGGSPV